MGLSLADLKISDAGGPMGARFCALPHGVVPYGGGYHGMPCGELPARARGARCKSRGDGGGGRHLMRKDLQPPD